MEMKMPSLGGLSGCAVVRLLHRSVYCFASRSHSRCARRLGAGRTRLALGLAWMLLSMPLLAVEEDEIRGFIVDNSISHIGHEFYRYFTERLRDTSRLDFNLVVRERPSARWGSLVWIEYEGRTLYRRFLAPNVAEVQPLAYEAADLIQEAVTRQQLERLLQDTYDLDKDEI